MIHLFTPFSLRDLTLRNRILMSPMCMYSAAEDGVATDWHMVHYVSRAVGGVGAIVMEATAVEPRGRISAGDLGLWSDAQVGPLARIVAEARAAGAAIGVQLAHAGRKAWSDQRGHGPEEAVAPSALPFDAGWRTPHALSVDEIEALLGRWRDAAARAEQAGCDLIEIHGAHGYLVHEFLSPLSNRRDDAFGGDLEGRARFLLAVVDAVREVWPAAKPLFVRLSATDWAEGGLTVDDTVRVAKMLKPRGVDLVDCSSGGAVAVGPADTGPGYQVPLSARVRREAAIPTAAVGLITGPEQAETVLRTGQADLVAFGRELLRNPYWPLEAAAVLGHDVAWPKQYVRARR